MTPVKAIDRYNIGHFAIGVLMQLSGASLSNALVIATVWEVVENGLKKKMPDFFPVAKPDTLANALFDIVSVYAGYKLMSLLPPVPKAAIWTRKEK